MLDTESFAPLSGGCACGYVRYRMETHPIIVHGCHCRYCQRMSGSAFSVNAMIEADRVTSIGDGEPEVIHTPSALPAGQKIHRCPRCLLALWSNYSLLGGLEVITRGLKPNDQYASPLGRSVKLPAFLASDACWNPI